MLVIQLNLSIVLTNIEIKFDEHWLTATKVIDSDKVNFYFQCHCGKVKGQVMLVIELNFCTMPINI